MRQSLTAGSLEIIVAGLGIALAPAAVHPARASFSADKVTRAIRGKTCTTKAGATFTFGQNGEYNYDGLWTDHGRYWVNNAAVTVLLDNGLERSFAISRKGGVLYMEQTALFCK